MNSDERAYRSSCSSHGWPNPVNSPLNQPETTLIENRPLLMRSDVAMKFASGPGFPQARVDRADHV